MRSLRGRLTLGVVAVLTVVLGTAAALFSAYAERIAREGLDERLRRTAELSNATAVDAVADQRPDSDERLDAVLGASATSLRLTLRDTEIFSAGRRLLDGPTPAIGLRTLTQGGRRFRVLVVAVPDAGLGDLARLEVASSLGELERRQAELDRRLLLLGLGALLLAALGTFLAAVRVLGPLRRLRLAAAHVAGEEDLSVRVSETDGPAEVRGLAATFNAMLARIGGAAAARERALAATRRFALDAGHELRTPLTTVRATLSALHRHPDVPAEQRAAMLADALEEQARLVTLLDGLQAYARGEVATVAREPVDLADVVVDVTRRHQGVTATVPDGPVVVTGWEPGLRLLAGNLVANAVRHGRGAVTVTLTADPVVLTVEDEGPGIPAEDAERVFEPFARLDAAAGTPGTGLGLALVAQQARDHGATVAVDGPRFTVRFP